MKRFYTEVEAVDPLDGMMKKWVGPIVEAESYEDAVRFCNENGLGYCEVKGEYIKSVGFWMNEKLMDRFFREEKDN